MIDLAAVRGRLRSARTRRALNLFGTIALVVIVVPFVVHAFPSVVGAEESYVVLSGSMEPALSPGDVVVVYGVSPAAVEEGDVITYQRDDQDVVVTHRVVEVVRSDDGQRLFRTRGDANEEPDAEPVPADAVTGRIPAVTLPIVGSTLLHFPAIGYLIVLIRGSPLLLGLFVGVPLVVLAVDGIRTFVAPSDSGGDIEPVETDGEAGQDVDAEPNGAEAETAQAVGAERAEEGTAQEEDTDPDDGDEPTTSPTDDSGVAGSGRSSAGAQEVEGAASTDSNTASGADERKTVAVTDTDLTLATVVLTAMATYSGIVGLLAQSALSLSLSLTAIGCIVFLTVIRNGSVAVADGPTDAGVDSADGPDPKPTGTVVEGHLPEDTEQLPVFSVDSIDVLVDRAEEVEGWIVRRDDSFAVVDGGCVYEYHDGRDGDEGSHPQESVSADSAGDGSDAAQADGGTEASFPTADGSEPEDTDDELD